MAQHTLKCWCPFFEAIERGDKPFEVRRDYRGFQKGDTLVLEKFDPKKNCYVLDGYGWAANPVTIRREITYVLSGGQFGIQPGYVVMGLRPPPAEGAEK